jgi:hypothetical protein
VLELHGKPPSPSRIRAMLIVEIGSIHITGG